MAMRSFVNRPITMFKAILRGLSLVCLAAALVSGVLDITRSIADSQIKMMPLHVDWARLAPSSLAWLHETVAAYLGEFFWNPVLLTVLQIPSWMAFTLLFALISLAAGRRKRRWQENFGA